MPRLVAVALVLGAALAAAPAGADVRVTISDGHVSVSAKDATIRQILTEWARVGQARIVNLERVTGAPITIELTNVPEAQALDVILRSVSGYVAAPRSTPLPGASRFDRILLLPTSVATASRPPAQAAPAPPPFRPAAPPPQDDQIDEDDDPRPPMPPQGAPNRPPVFNGIPQPAPGRDVEPPAAPTSYPAPTSPVGVAVPGMPVPAPQAPAQTPRPGQPRR